MEAVSAVTKTMFSMRTLYRILFFAVALSAYTYTMSVYFGNPNVVYVPVDPVTGHILETDFAGSAKLPQSQVLEEEAVTNRKLLKIEEPGCSQKSDEAKDSFRMLMLCALLSICFLTAFTLRRLHSKYLHESTTSILLGVIVGVTVRFLSTEEQLLAVSEFDAEFFFLFLLPPIIFESGYNFNKRVFFRNIVPITLFAIIGTVVSAAIFGLGIWGLTFAHIFNYQLSAVECMLFGALISATDPVTVLAIFKEIHVDGNLYACVFGESVLNDAVALVLYKTLLGFLGASAITAGSVMTGIAMFFIIFIGSMLVGIFVGLLSALLFRYSDLYKNTTIELALLVLYALSSYLFADGLGLSGIVAVLFCGITMAHYTRKNLSVDTKHNSIHLFELAAFVSETFVFCYLGLTMVSVLPDFDIWLMFFSVLLMLIGRAAHIFPLSIVMNFAHMTYEKIEFKHQFMLWFAGLRGAMAFALAYELREVAKHGDVIMTTTLLIVLLTVLVLGGATNKTLSLLKIKMGDLSTEEESELSKHKTVTWFLKLDMTYIRPFFTRDKNPDPGNHGESSHQEVTPAETTGKGDHHVSELVVDDGLGAAEEAAVARSRSEFY